MLQDTLDIVVDEASSLVEEDMLVAVYRATNKINRKFYIGITRKTLHQRNYSHFSLARTGKGKTKFSKALRKHGIENFNFEVLWYARSWSEACEEEKRLIRILQPEYNLTLGGEGTLGHRHKPEVAKLIGQKARLKNLGAKRSDLTRERMRIGRRNNPTPIENRQRHRLGVKPSPESIAKMVATKKLNPTPLTAKQREILTKGRLRSYDVKRKAVICVTDGREFISVTEAAKHYGIAKSSILFVCFGKAESRCGLVFKWKNPA